MFTSAFTAACLCMAGNAVDLTSQFWEDDYSDSKAIIVRLTDEYTYAGFQGDANPSVKLETVTGKETSTSQGVLSGGVTGDDGLKVFVGIEAIYNQAILDVTNPVRDGSITDFTSISFILEHAIKTELGSYPDEHYLLMTLAPKVTDDTRNRLAEILFDEFNVPGLSFQDDALMSLMSTGRTAGLVIQTNGNTADIVPIYEAYVDRSAVRSVQNLSSVQEELVTQISNAFEQTINSVDVDIRDELLENIIVVSSNPLLADSGAQGLLEESFRNFVPASSDLVSVEILETGEEAAFIGASILTSLSSFEAFWVTADEWNEYGTAALEKKSMF